MNKKYDNNNIIIASRAYFLQEGRCQEVEQAVTPLVARPRAGPRHHKVWLAPGSSPAFLWTLSSCQVIRDFGFYFVQFREYFLCNFSETQKQQKTGN
jgi:hypothetical protein